jgi:hypothetical protein
MSSLLLWLFLLTLLTLLCVNTYRLLTIAVVTDAPRRRTVVPPPAAPTLDASSLLLELDGLQRRLERLPVPAERSAAPTPTPAPVPAVSLVPSALTFEQQRAYSAEYQAHIDSVALDLSRVDVDVNDERFLLSVSASMRDAELRGSGAVRGAVYEPFLSPRGTACDLATANDSHVQHDMRAIPHAPPAQQRILFDKHVNELQFPARCASARLLLYSHWADNGLGSELHWLQVALTAAFLLNRTLVVREDQGWLWADRDTCGDRTFSCLFEPLSSCEAVGRDGLVRLVAPQTLADVPIVSPADMAGAAARSERVLQWQNAGGLAREVPLPFRHEWPRPVFWWRAQLCRFLFRPRRYVLALVAERKESIYGSQWRGKSRAAIHIRAGDKTHGNGIQVVEMPHATVDVAIERLDYLFSQCPFEVAFVSTRDPRSLQQLQERAASLPYKLLFDGAQVRYGDGFHTLDLIVGHLNRTQEALQYIKDIVLMTDADFFVGAMESNVARIVAELGSAHERFAGPPTTLLSGTYIVWP